MMAEARQRLKQHQEEWTASATHQHKLKIKPSRITYNYWAPLTMQVDDTYKASSFLLRGYRYNDMNDKIVTFADQIIKEINGKSMQNKIAARQRKLENRIVQQVQGIKFERS